MNGGNVWHRTFPPLENDGSLIKKDTEVAWVETLGKFWRTYGGLMSKNGDDKELKVSRSVAKSKGVDFSHPAPLDETLWRFLGWRMEKALALPPPGAEKGEALRGHILKSCSTCAEKVEKAAAGKAGLEKHRGGKRGDLVGGRDLRPWNNL